jgi:4-hydroxythreonine-4-phosphate dehydrogenase
MKKNIVIVAGDPNSVNSEIIYKTWKKLSLLTKKRLYIIGNYALIVKQLKKINLKKKIIKLKEISLRNNTNELKILDIPLKFKNPFNVNVNNSSDYILQSLSLAHKLSIEKKVGGMINCPIDKRLLAKSKKIGVTEYLASKCGIRNNSEVMMLFNKELAVVPLTTHIGIKKISKKITTSLIIKKINVLNKDYTKIFKKKPKIGVLGLNPHNGELRKNSEEKKIIIPAISKLKKNYINIQGPLVADTTFISKYKNFDVIVGMYHDQVLGPFKTLFKFDAINITLGLNYVRVSPDHGPAKDIINKNKADHVSLLRCIKFIDNLN